MKASCKIISLLSGLILLMSSFSFAGCGGVKKERTALSLIEKIPVEVDDIVMATTNALKYRGSELDFMKEERKLVDCGALEWRDTYFDWTEWTDDAYYYLHEYAVRHIDTDGGKDVSRSDQGLFKADLRTGKLTLLKDIKNIIPERKYVTVHNSVVKKFVDDRYCIMSYNGNLEVFDLLEGKTSFQTEVYSKPEEYSLTENGANFNFLHGGCDCFFTEGGRLDYYLYENGKYVKKTFYDTVFTNSISWAKRYGDRVYFPTYYSSSENIVWGVNIKSGEIIDENELQTSYDRDKFEYGESGGDEEEQTKELTLGGKRYAMEEVRVDNRDLYKTECTSLNLTDLSTGRNVTVDTELLRQNEAFCEAERIYEETFEDYGKNNDLTDPFFSAKDDKLSMREWYLSDGRLFIGAYRMLGKRWTSTVNTPTFVFEYVPESGEVKYCGFLRAVTRVCVADINVV